MTLYSKRCEITWPTMRSITCSVFSILVCWRLFSSITNLWEMDLKFPGWFLMSVLKILHRVLAMMPRGCIFKNQRFEILVCYQNFGLTFFIFIIWSKTSLCLNITIFVTFPCSLCFCFFFTMIIFLELRLYSKQVRELATLILYI